MAIVDKSPLNMQLRVNVALGVCAACFFVIILRLYYLQILRGDFFRERSENNRLRTVYTQPPRGFVFDRDGKVLVRNRPSFNIDLVVEDAPDPKATLETLADVLHMDRATLVERGAGAGRRTKFEPRLILKDVSRDVVAQVVAHRYRLPGIVVDVVPAREYLYGEFASHVMGYIREITQVQLEQPFYALYRQGDLVGQFGIEYQWEEFLQGRRGVQNVIVNAMGNKIGEASFEPETAGNNLTLTIDFDVQKRADEALEGKKGGVVALHAKTGEVIAMSSAPRFDPNMFTSEITSDMWSVLKSRESLSNRTMQGGYPPGSVFKIFMAAAALNEGVTDTHEGVNCPGFLPFGGRRFGCHKRTGHGGVALREALVMSCDVYFYTIGQRLGIDTIHDYSTRFGLGLKTGVGLGPGKESAGIVPSTAWKKKYFRKVEDQKWYPGETLSVAIGQGALVTTPLQVARGVAALVNGGNLLKPYLVKQIQSDDGNFVDDNFKTEVIGSLGIPEKILKVVRDDLVGVVNDQRGTGHKAKMDKDVPVIVGGKTGTAQAATLGLGDRHAHLQDHAWFVGFAPAEDPEIVVAALIENGGHGGAAAAPVVKEVMDAYFRKKLGIPKVDPAGAEKAAAAAPARDLSD